MMSQGNFKFIHTQFFSRLIECTTPSFLQGRGGGASYQIFKKGGLPESQFLENDCWEKGGDFFMGGRGRGGVQFLHK